MSIPELQPDTKLIRTAQLPSAELGPDDIVLLDADNAVYYGLKGPARDIWDLLESETSIARICEALTKKYRAEPGECERDTTDFVRQLLENGLVTAR